MKRLVVAFVVIVSYLSLVESQEYRICARKKHEEACSQIQRHGNIKCVFVDNEATCLTKMDIGEVDFGTVNAETAFLASKLTKNVTAIAYLVPDTEVGHLKYETVITTTEQITNFGQLKTMSYCHPGFDKTEIPPLLLKEFEMKIMKESSNLCEKDLKTISEIQLSALSQFFGPSCRPGQWVADKELDKQLKEKYSNLLELCSKFELLSKSDVERSLHCMLNTPRSISLTTLNTVKNLINGTREIYYLCKNGTTSKNECVWSSQPYQLLVINNNQNNLEGEAQEWFSANLDPMNKHGNTGRLVLTDVEVKYIKEILGISGDITMNLAFVRDKPGTLENFTKSFRDIPTNDDQKLCKRSTKWCTTSADEQQKCNWLSQASLNYGIQPIVECVPKASEFECMHAIKAGMEDADIITISADYGYAAKRHDLAAIAFPETTSDQEINTLLLVKGENITRLENLKGKSGCFPLYSGIAWLSFVNTTRGIILPLDTCDYGKALSENMGDSCMPGAMKTSRVVQNEVDAEKMCKLCTDSDTTCDANESNMYYKTAGALKCLDERGDFAVIVKDPSVVLPRNVQVMCKNGSLSTLDGIDVDEHCYLSVLTTSEVITRRNDWKNEDIKLALMEYDRWFAAETHTPFRLFDSFNGTKDLLFKDSTPGLDLPTSEKKAVKNYVDVFKHIDDCAGASNNNIVGGKASIAFITTLILELSLLINAFL